MKIEKSDEIVYPALFKDVNSSLTVIAADFETGMVIVPDKNYEMGYADDSWKDFTNISEWQHISNLVPEIIYPAVFEDENGFMFLFTNPGSGALLNHSKSITRYGHKNMKHLYNAKIVEAD